MSPTDAPVELRLRRLILGATDPANRAERAALIRRGAIPDPAVRESARATLAAIRDGGDDALREANGRFGGGRPDGRLLLDRSELRAARDALEPRVRRGASTIDHVRRFAEPQRPQSTRTRIAPGIDLERRWAPLASVGCYVPGGSAPYPSSLVMTVVPAQVAGVERIVVASPADRAGRQPPGPPGGRRPARGRRLRRRRWRAGHRGAGVRPAGRPASNRWTASSARATPG